MEKFNIVKRITKPTEINTYTFILFQQFLNIAYSLGKDTTSVKIWTLHRPSWEAKTIVRKRRGKNTDCHHFQCNEALTTRTVERSVAKIYQAVLTSADIIQEKAIAEQDLGVCFSVNNHLSKLSDKHKRARLCYLIMMVCNKEKRGSNDCFSNSRQSLYSISHN